MFSTTTLTLAFAAAGLKGVLGCPEHDFHAIHKRQAPETGGAEWAYEASYNWGELSPEYVLCQAGTQQSPIPLLLTQGLSLNHYPNFEDYSESAAGVFYNWGYGPAFAFDHPEDDYSSLPSFTFNDATDGNETVYLTGWHIHAPADHSVGGVRSKAELHFVHVNSEGDVRSVLAFRIDPGSAPSPFFEQLPELISFRNESQEVNMTLNPFQAIQEVNRFNEFWTYQGSLTSPPCTKGIRWYMARNTLFVDVPQMQEILAVSTYSARAEQQVWQQQINV